MECSFCNKVCKNSNSLRNHERLCNQNPNRQILKSNFIEYHKKLKEGLVKKEATNQYTKAKLLGEKYVISDEMRKKLSEANYGRKHSNQTKQKLSQARSSILEEVGGGGFTHIKYYDAVNTLNESYKVRGTWELKVANWLTENNILWKRKLYLTYTTIDNIKRTYTPDFYLPDLNIYLEVKGYFSDRDKDKLHLVVKENNINLFLVIKEHIESLSGITHISQLLTKNFTSS
jgi:hypothetical protein